MEHALLHQAANMNSGRWPGFNHNFDLAGWNIADPAMQGEIHFHLLTRGVVEPVVARMPHPFNATTDQPFIEPLQPAESVAALQIDKLRVDDFFDR